MLSDVFYLYSCSFAFFVVCIVVAFFTCFAPFHAERLIVVLMPAEMWINNQVLWKLHDVLYHISGICLFANSVCNPILYNIVSHRIRAEFKAALICCGRSRRRRSIERLRKQGQFKEGRTVASSFAQHSPPGMGKLQSDAVTF